MQTVFQEWLSEDQVAQLTGISTRTLQSWRVSGDGPAYSKLGRAVRYSKKKLEAWIEQNSRRHTSESAAR